MQMCAHGLYVWLLLAILTGLAIGPFLSLSSEEPQ